METLPTKISHSMSKGLLRVKNDNIRSLAGTPDKK
jgi:hypothetical protein